MTSPLEEFVAQAYRSDEYQALLDQRSRWCESKPLSGLRILDCTPFFRNTLAKFIPLVAAGAEVTVGVHPDIPFDPAMVAELPDLGLQVANADESPGRFDIVMDCAGRHADVESSYGYVELTHSGVTAYSDSNSPVVVVDHSHLKLLETMFGTGDGFFRALETLEPSALVGPIVVFGAGKVGSGIAHGAISRGVPVTVVDSPNAANYAHAPLLPLTDQDGIRSAIASASVVVTASGVRNAAAPFARDLMQSTATLANMGVDDEFGPEVPDASVLYAKVPVNFALPEPTLLTYMDPIFALSNAAALELTGRGIPAGLNAPSREVEEGIESALREAGILEAELDEITIRG